MSKPKTSKTKQEPAFMPFEELGIIDGSAGIPIHQLQGILQRAEEYYGVNSLVRFDAGHNNISVEVCPSKKSVLNKPRFEEIQLDYVAQWSCDTCGHLNETDSETKVGTVLSCSGCNKQVKVGDVI